MSSIANFFTLKWLWANPVAIKELRSRMRGGRPFLVIQVYLGAMIWFSYIILSVLLQGIGPEAESGLIGVILFVALSLVQLFMVLFITPGITAVGISKEREQQTFNLLLTTPLTPWQIVTGKLISSIGYLILLTLVSFPVVSAVFFLGGVSPVSFLKIYLVILATLITYGTIGTFFSAVFKKTQSAIIFSYLSILFFTIGTFVLSLLAYVYITYLLAGNSGMDPFMVERQVNSAPNPSIVKQALLSLPKAILYLNPFVAIGSTLGRDARMMGMIPFMSFDVPGGGKPVYAWKYMIWSYTALSLLLLLISSKLIKPDLGGRGFRFLRFRKKNNK